MGWGCYVISCMMQIVSCQRPRVRLLEAGAEAISVHSGVAASPSKQQRGGCQLELGQLMTSQVAGPGWPQGPPGSTSQLPVCRVEPLCSPPAAWSSSPAHSQGASACRVARKVLPCRSLSTNPERNLSALWGKLAAEILMQNWDTAMDYLTKLKVHPPRLLC